MKNLLTSTEDKMKEALKKDFRVLYAKEFTTDWKTQRMLRELEIDVMGIENLEAFLLKTIQEVREEGKFTAFITDLEFSKVLQSLEGMELISPKLRVDIERLCVKYINSFKK